MLTLSFRSGLLLTASAGLLLMTAGYVHAYGSQVYFLVFHRPFHLAALAAAPTSPVRVLPALQVSSRIGQAIVRPGGTESITVSVQPATAATGVLEVWVRGPLHRNVFQSPANDDAVAPITFSRGQDHIFHYNYMVPPSAPKGTYFVSERITSPDLKTDYQLHENFAAFTVP